MSAVSTGSAGQRWQSLLPGFLLLGLLTLVAHGWCLADGTVLDDHWHQRGLRVHGWGYFELLRSLEIEPADWMQVWWQDKVVRWDYGRPLFILAMKFVYHVLGGDDPFALHAFSLLLHWLSACLLWRFAAWLVGGGWWCWLAAAAFVLYPHAVITVAWPSSQNVVMSTALLLGGLLAYRRASRLDEAGAPPVRRGWLAAVLVLWVLALFTRENSLLLAPLLVGLDLMAGGWPRLRARMPVYAGLALIGLAFIGWRLGQVTAPMPDVYTRRPDGDLLLYAGWLLAKLGHYLTTAVWIAPMTIGPTGRIDPWREVPVETLVTCVLPLAYLGGYAWLSGRQRGWWLWPAWIVLAILPVLPVIATPHSGYLCGVGMALGLATCAAGVRATSRRRLGRGLLLATLAGYALFTMLNRWQWTGIIAAERFTTEWMLRDPPPAPVRDVYVLNLPFVSVYAKPRLDRIAPRAFADKRMHVLTFAPTPTQVEGRTWLEQVDDCTLLVRIEGQPYFSRFNGRFVHEAFRAGPRLAVGEAVRGAGFEATVVEDDSEGIRTLQFRFDRPLADPRACFYLVTIDSVARLRFTPRPDGRVEGAFDLASATAALAGGSADAGDWLLRAAQGADVALAEAAAAAVHPSALALAESLGAPLQDVLGQRVLSSADWSRVAAWWRRSVDDELLHVLWVQRDALLPLVKAREEVPNARRRLAEYLRADLYLTGPAFPGPATR